MYLKNNESNKSNQILSTDSQQNIEKNNGPLNLSQKTGKMHRANLFGELDTNNDTLSNNKSTAGKFKSNYMNDSGKWTIKAVDDGFVEFDDYISDIENTLEEYPSYNNKNFKVTNKKADIYSEGNNYNNAYEVDTSKDVENFAFIPGIKDKIKGAINVVKDREKHSEWVVDNLGYNVAGRSFMDGETALHQAKNKAKELGLDSVWNNTADAYRHFIWNVKMTRDDAIGYYNSRNITNRYEYEAMLDKGWIVDDSGEFDYLKDNTIIKGKMNQETFMDLWNNQVGRELANNKEFEHMSEDGLFDFAQQYNLLITDANKTYDFLGITDYITDPETYTVDTEWNLTNGNVTVKKDGKSVTLKIGI